jgi:hypothetical protein
VVKGSFAVELTQNRTKQIRRRIKQRFTIKSLFFLTSTVDEHMTLYIVLMNQYGDLGIFGSKEITIISWRFCCCLLDNICWVLKCDDSLKKNYKLSVIHSLKTII